MSADQTADLEQAIRAVLVRELFSSGKEPLRSEAAGTGGWWVPGDGAAAASMLDSMVAGVVAACKGREP